MPAKTERCVTGLYNNLIQEFRKKYNKEPSTDRKKEFESKAWAICKSQEQKGW